VPALTAIERLPACRRKCRRHPTLGYGRAHADFRPEQLSELLDRARTVRIGSMRGTIHLLSRSGLPGRALVQPVFDRVLFSSAEAKSLRDIPRDEFVEAGRTAVNQTPAHAGGVAPLSPRDGPTTTRPRCCVRCSSRSRLSKCRRADSGSGAVPPRDHRRGLAREATRP